MEMLAMFAGAGFTAAIYGIVKSDWNAIHFAMGCLIIIKLLHLEDKL